ncbi:glycosyltransferase [Hungatella hathewayi]|uniref:glycosyltransferase n=1 Tax=Hungatella hathewayi TaxID=154046 RepID=UPI002A80F522|nr:glycosyltransferase [Hungatella hathewayi]
MKEKKVTIIILTWNGLLYTKKCINSLYENMTYKNCEIVIVDNGSTDETLEYLEQLDHITLIKNNKNLGFVQGNNIAINQIYEGDIILLNNDIIITQKKWIEELQKTAYSKEDYGIVGCRLINEKKDFLHAGTYIYPETYWGQQIGGGQKEVGQYSGDREVEGVVFACAYIKRSVLDAIGGLNEKFFSYFEDTDYCLRAREAGFKTVCCGSVTLIHYQNVSTNVNKTNFSDMFLKSQKTFKELWDKKLSERYLQSVAWQSIVNFPSGYAVSAKNMMLGLDDLNVDVRYKYVYGKGTPFPVEEPPVSDNYRINVIHSRKFLNNIPQIVYGQGDVFQKNTGKYKIGFTMLETTGIPKEWVRQANTMNEVWVPSSFNVRTFKDSGVKVPIYTIPLGIDPDFFNPNIKSYKKHDRYTFLSIFEWGERKAPELMLNAFSKAFSKKDNVLLICKVFNNDGSISVEKEIEKLDLPPNGPEIIFLYNHRIADYQMATLYRSADCFVLPTRGEGWGMPILEAMACGLPTIATNWSSQVDFMSSENAYPLEIDGLIDAKAKCPYYDGFQWANPSEEHLIYLMRYVYEHQEEAKEKGKTASRDVLENWTWKNSACQIKKRLNTINAK